jgi:hypothetical protein
MTKSPVERELRNNMDPQVVQEHKDNGEASEPANLCCAYNAAAQAVIDSQGEQPTGSRLRASSRMELKPIMSTAKLAGNA